MRIRMGDTILADNIDGMTLHVDTHGNTEIVVSKSGELSPEAIYVRDHPEEVRAEKLAVIDRQPWTEEQKSAARIALHLSA